MKLQFACVIKIGFGRRF